MQHTAGRGDVDLLSTDISDIVRVFCGAPGPKRGVPPGDYPVPHPPPPQIPGTKKDPTAMRCDRVYSYRTEVRRGE